MPSPSIPRSIPVPIGPADDSRASPAPRRAYSHSVSTKRDLRENPEDVEDPLVALRLRDEVRAEDRVDVEGGEREIVGNRGRIEEERPDCERREDERGENGSQKASQTSGAVPGGRGSAGSLSRRIGPPYGYRLVTSRAYAYVCAE